jgi:RHS repeat-associated protein
VRPSIKAVNGKYFPYGQERPSATTDGKEKFATYFRDSETGLDYANARYHQPGMGRFMTADSAPSAGAGDPGSWNRYAYTRGDPVNRADPGGTADCDPNTCITVSANVDQVEYITISLTQSVGSWWANQAAVAIANAQSWINTQTQQRATSWLPTNPASNWNSALGALSATRDQIINMQYKKGCTDLLAQFGVTVDQEIQAAGGGFFRDATTSTDLRSSLFAGTAAYDSVVSDPAYQVTIAAYFASHPTVMAVTSFTTDLIYFRSSGVDTSSLSYNGGLVMHELLHTLGKDDNGLLLTLGYKQSDIDAGRVTSQEISKALSSKCF